MVWVLGLNVSGIGFRVQDSGCRPPPQDYHRALGIVLLYGPKGTRFLMSEVPWAGGGDQASGDTTLCIPPPHRTLQYERGTLGGASFFGVGTFAPRLEPASFGLAT